MKFFYLFCALIFSLLYSNELCAALKHNNQILRKMVTELDCQENTASNVQFYTANYGIFGMDVRNLTG